MACLSLSKKVQSDSKIFALKIDLYYTFLVNLNDVAKGLFMDRRARDARTNAILISSAYLFLPMLIGVEEPEKPIAADMAKLIEEAQQHYDLAQQYLEAGDWAGYGEELDALEAVLNQLAALSAEGINSP